MDRDAYLKANEQLRSRWEQAYNECLDELNVVDKEEVALFKQEKTLSREKKAEWRKILDEKHSKRKEKLRLALEEIQVEGLELDQGMFERREGQLKRRVERQVRRVRMMKRQLKESIEKQNERLQIEELELKLVEQDAKLQQRREQYATVREQRIAVTKEADEHPHFLCMRYARTCFVCKDEHPGRRAVSVECGHLICASCVEDKSTDGGEDFACPTCATKTTFVNTFENKEDSSNSAVLDDTPRFSRSCTICLSVNPRQRVAMAQCGHITCALCADQLGEKGSEFPCPFCRKRTNYVKIVEEREDPNMTTFNEKEAVQRCRKRKLDETEDQQQNTC